MLPLSVVSLLRSSLVLGLFPPPPAALVVVVVVVVTLESVSSKSAGSRNEEQRSSSRVFDGRTKYGTLTNTLSLSVLAFPTQPRSFFFSRLMWWLLLCESAEVKVWV